MPSTAFGPLIEPGWPSTLPGQPDLGKTFLNAFAIGSEINRRKQQLENQVMAMSLRNQQMQHMDELRQLEYERKVDQGNQRLEMAQQAMNLKDAMFDWKRQKDQETMDDVTGLAQGLGAIQLAPDDPKKPSAIWDVIQKNARAVKYAPGLIKDAFGNYNTAVRATRSKFSSEYNDFLKDVKNTIGRGQSTDLDLLHHPELWKEEWVDKQGGSHEPPPLDEKGNRPDWAKDWTKSKQVYATVPNTDRTKPDVFIKLPATLVTGLMNREKELQQKMLNLPEQVANEYVNPVPIGSQMSDQDMRMLNWARSHPGDPNAARIKEKLGVTE